MMLIANGKISGQFNNNISFNIDENTVINFKRDVGQASHKDANHFNIQVMTRRKNGKMKEKLNLHIYVDVDSNGKFIRIKRVDIK